jgi:hypothetical protein
MYSKLHNRLGTAGLVVAIVALVAALAGTAFAAAGLNSKQKKEVKSIAKSFQGTGPQGPVGPAGAKGDKGDAGSAGGNGKSIVTASEPEGANCAEGGTSLEVEGSGVKKFACNGEEGSPWAAGGTLPVGATETGTWGGSSHVSGTLLMPITFTLPLPEAPEVVVDGNAGEGCPGVAGGIPAADPGKLCIYTGVSKNGAVANFFDPTQTTPVPGASPAGTMVLANCGEEEEACIVYGTWAATAE